MADDPIKTTPGTGIVSDSGNAEPEARIIEETIIRPVAPSPIPPAPPPTIPPPKVTPVAPVPVTSATTFGSFTPNKLGITSEKKIPALPAQDASLTPQPPAATPQGDNSNASFPSSNTKPASDVTQILRGITLPERRVMPGSGVQEVKLRTYDTSLGGVLSDENKKEENAPEVRAATTETSKTGSENASFIVAPLRTLKNDLQDIVRDKKMSFVRAVSLEQDKRRGSNRESALETKKPRSHRTFIIVSIAILLLVLGSAVFSGIAIIMQEKSVSVSAPADTSLLFAEVSLPFSLEDISAFQIKSALSGFRARGTPALGSITRITPTVNEIVGAEDLETRTREATLGEFLSALGTRASPNLIRALDDEFFFGIHTVDKNAPVLVIPVLSYERAFAGMLEWESTMNADLAPAFTSVPSTLIGANGLLEKRQFEDLIMRNYDTRALKDNSGTIQLFYSFPTRNILIIAESPYSFVEALARLRAERKL